MNRKELADHIRSLVKNNDLQKGIKLFPGQKRALLALADFFEREKRGQTYIKMPTGTGKSILASILIQGLQQDAIFFTESTDLFSQMKQELGIAGYNGRTIDINNLPGNNIISKVTFYLKYREKNQEQHLVIFTYAALRILKKQDENLFNAFMKHFPHLYVDEAHKAIGEMTLDTIDEAVNIIKSSSSYNILIGLTASPTTTQNTVNKLGKCAFNYSIGEAVQNLDIVKPVADYIGDAFLHDKGDARSSYSPGFLDKNTERFITKEGKPIHEALTERYIKYKGLQ